MDIYVMGEKDKPPYDGEIILTHETRQEAMSVLDVPENKDRLALVGLFAVKLTEADLARCEAIPTVTIIDKRQV